MTSCFLTGSSNLGLADSEIVVSRSGLLRQIVADNLVQTVHTQGSFLKLTNELIRLAEQAYVLRDVETLDEVSRVLMNLPVGAARQIGSYYYSLAIYRKGRREEANSLLKRTAFDAPITYAARSIQSLGANYLDKGQPDETLRFQLEALRAASDKDAHGLKTTLLARWEIAIVRSLSGDHYRALEDLQALWSLVLQVAAREPFYFYVFHNGLAVELGEIGRIDEAMAACQIALASPFAPAYPEWAETRLELEAKRTSATPSVVAVSRLSEVIPSPQTQPQPCQKPNQVIAFWWLGIRGAALQIALIPFAGLRVRARQAKREILEVLGRCSRSRAPPVRTE